jgi:hypothetical protein
MFRNGIYKIGYRSPLHDEGSGEHALAIVRDGQIIGSDRLGAVFTGETEWPARSLNWLTVELTVPAGGELITGKIAGPEGATLTIQSHLDPEKLGQFAVIDVAGDPVEIQVCYLGPLPE